MLFCVLGDLKNQLILCCCWWGIKQIVALETAPTLTTLMTVALLSIANLFILSGSCLFVSKCAILTSLRPAAVAEETYMNGLLFLFLRESLSGPKARLVDDGRTLVRMLPGSKKIIFLTHLGWKSFFVRPITAQAIRAPAFPVVDEPSPRLDTSSLYLPRSSGSACSTTILPTTE